MGLRAEVYTDEHGRIINSLKADFGLTRKRYVFYWCESLGVVLDSYSELSRKTTRHKFRITCNWDRLNIRDNRIPKPEPLPGVASVALEQIKDQIKFKGGW
jgi:hypothetical protein